MEYRRLHDWTDNPEVAVSIQMDLGPLVVSESCFEKLEHITAVDTAFNINTNRLYAAAVTLTYPELTDTERVVGEMETSFPYLPALLSFREGPVILKTLSRLKIRPDLVIFAGHGVAHPRSFGMASHLGLLLDIPSIGCARKCLVGEYSEPPVEKGGCSSLSLSNIACGFVYRTRSGVKPMFISPGHKCSMDDALKIIINCLGQYRMPLPLRLAHMYANKYRRSAERKNRAVKDWRANRKEKKRAMGT